ncbi:MAG TPA: DUF6596 domain-containing protein [Acidimicrobiales bacterium]
MSDLAREAITLAHRREWARVLAATVRSARDIDVAQECAQDAFAEALERWPIDGVPENPGAWLTTVARRRAVDVQRRTITYRRKLPLLVEPDTEPDDRGEPGDERDDTLRLIFMCCHPALSGDAQMALTLRLVCGTPTSDVAHCFLVSEATMAARITRAKKKIALARIPFKVPAVDEMPARLEGALGVVYLLFTVGHTSPSGAFLLQREALDEASRLARLLYDLLPDEPEVKGLYALLLVNRARQDSRVTDRGVPRRISDQDRTTWDHEAIAEAHELIVDSLRSGRAGKYTLQAAIASLHAHAASFEDVDWPQILELYDQLVAIWASPVVELNRAIALAKVDGPESALTVVEELERRGTLEGYHYLPATKAYLLDELGRGDEASLYRNQARALAGNDVERASLL